MKSARSMSLIELIIAMALLGVVILAISSAHLFFQNTLDRNISESMLVLATQTSVTRIMGEVSEATYLEIQSPPDNGSLILVKRQPDTGIIAKSKYYLDSGSKELRYIKNVKLAKGYEVVQKNIQRFSVDGKWLIPFEKNRYRRARIIIVARDPDNKTGLKGNPLSISLQGSSHCRCLHMFAYKFPKFFCDCCLKERQTQPGF